MEVLLVFPVCNVRLAEANMHHILHQYRLVQQHELFDLGADQQAITTILQQARELTQRLDSLAGVDPPEDLPVDMDEWRAAKQRSRDGAKQQRGEQIAQARREAKRAEKLMKQKIKANLEAEAYEEKLRSEAAAKEQTTKVNARYQHDTVKAFVEDSLEHTGDPAHYIERSTLYEAYKVAYPEEKVKKTSLGKRKWFDLLQKHIGSEGYHAHPRLSNGKRPRDVWFQWQMNSSKSEPSGRT